MGFDRYPAVDDNTEFPPEVAKANMPIVLSTSQRDALAAARKWDGRQIYNSTTKRYERWDSASSLWRTIADQQDMSTLLTSSAPVGMAAAAAVGTSNFAARSDHVHPLPAVIAGRLYATAGTTLAATAWTQITLAGESYDTANWAANSQFVTPKAGLVDVRGRVSVIGAPNERYIVCIYVNGAEATRGVDGAVDVGNNTWGGGVSDILDLPSGAVITLRMYNAVAGARNTEAAAQTAWLTCRML